MTIGAGDLVAVVGIKYVPQGVPNGATGIVVLNAGTYSLVSFNGVNVSIWNTDLNLVSSVAVPLNVKVTDVATTDAKPKQGFVDKEEMWRAIQDISGGRK